MMMMRGVNGRDSNSALETINAAASAIAAAESRVPQATAQKRRWSKGWWGVYWCFGFQRHRKRIGQAVILPETSSPRGDGHRSDNSTQASSVVLPFTAPPSSPASLLQSEPPSAMQSPACFTSSISASMYSPGPASIFAIGPYANETQLVSPPVFSTFTTEPSTAPFTPPPESVHLTTPSSPEVPFAQLLDPNFRIGEGGPRFPLSHYEFQSYQLYPGSPVGQLISPSSGISGSGTSSPFLDSEFASGGHHFLEFRTGEAPKLLNLDILFTRDWGSRLGSGSVTPDAARSTSSDGFTLRPQTPEDIFNAQSNGRHRTDEVSLNHRVSFDLSAEESVRCVEKKPVALAEAASTSQQGTEENAKIEEDPNPEASSLECSVVNTSNDASENAVGGDGMEAFQRHQKERSITLGSSKEFNFDNADGGDSGTSNISSDWWANEKVVLEENGQPKDWSFPMIQPTRY